MPTTTIIHCSLPWIVLISIFMFVLPRTSHTFSAPGSFALAISFPVVLGLYSVYGIGLHIASNVAALVACIIFVLTISTILSDRPDMALKHLIVYSAAAFIGVAFSGYNTLSIVMYSAIIHSVFICIPWSGRGNGWLGNSNFAGAFLAPCVFIAWYLNEPLAAGLFVLVLIRTRCKGAMLGLIAGAIFINPIALIVFVLIFARFVLTKRQRSSRTMRSRASMWRTSLKLMTIKRLSFGVGGDVGRILFMRNRHARYRFRRLHSDIIQGLFDGGIFYVILYLGIGIYSVMTAPPELAAALLSLMIAGLFVDTQLVYFTSALFWLLVGKISFSAAPAIVMSPWMLPFAIVIFVLVIQTWGRAFVADTIHGVAFRRGNGKLMALAHRINPSDDLATASLVGAMILSKQHGPAFDLAWKLVDRYDGSLNAEIPYYLLAVASFNVGAYPIAKAMAQQCLVYCDHDGAKKLLEVMGKRGL